MKNSIEINKDDPSTKNKSLDFKTIYTSTLYCNKNLKNSQFEIKNKIKNQIVL